MVSKASEDLPEPLSPVMTTRRSRGISTEMFLRLCSRAPMTAMRSVGRGHLDCVVGEGVERTGRSPSAVRMGVRCHRSAAPSAAPAYGAGSRNVPQRILVVPNEGWGIRTRGRRTTGAVVARRAAALGLSDLLGDRTRCLPTRPRRSRRPRHGGARRAMRCRIARPGTRSM